MVPPSQHFIFTFLLLNKGVPVFIDEIVSGIVSIGDSVRVIGR